MTAVLSFAFALLLGYVGVQLVKRYMAATGTVSERLWAAVQGSSTVAVSYANLAATSLAWFVLDTPGMKEAVQGVIPSQYWPWLTVTWVALSAYLARRRTLP